MVVQPILKLLVVRARVMTLFLVFATLMNGQTLIADFVPTVEVGNAGNEAKEVSADTGLNDTRWFKSGNFGSVSYRYRIGTTEVTNAQYAAFLNAVAVHDRHGLYDERHTSDPRGGIIRSGEHRNYQYSAKPLMGNKPVVFVTYYDALRFANWMHNGQPNGAQTSTTTEDGAYSLLNRTFPQLFNVEITRNPNAQWFLPSEDEWFKAAYHMNDGVTGNYYDYPTSSNEEPSIAIADEFGDVVNSGSNVANYLRGADWNGLDGNVTSVGSAGSVSAYGTFDQAGNVDEWTETVVWAAFDGSPGTFRVFPVVRGGTFFQINDFHIVGVTGGTRDLGGPGGNVDHIGFRVATVFLPERGDFDLDGDVDVNDINAYMGNIGSAATGALSEFDLTGDGQITLTDVKVHVENHVETSNGQTGTFLGDLDLDGTVSILSDAFTLIGNLGNSEASYSDGDINLDGKVDILGDAFSLVSNLHKSNTTAVP